MVLFSKYPRTGDTVIISVGVNPEIGLISGLISLDYSVLGTYYVVIY